MAVYVFTTCHLTWDTVDLSDHVRDVTLDTGADAKDATAMNATTIIYNPGLLTWTLKFKLLQDYAAASVDVTLNTDVGAKKIFVLRPTSAVKSATNPEYGGTAIITGYTPIQGSVGDMAYADVTCVAGSALSHLTT